MHILQMTLPHIPIYFKTHKYIYKMINSIILIHLCLNRPHDFKIRGVIVKIYPSIDSYKELRVRHLFRMLISFFCSHFSSYVILLFLMFVQIQVFISIKQLSSTCNKHDLFYFTFYIILLTIILPLTKFAPQLISIIFYTSIMQVKILSNCFRHHF